MTKTQDKYLWQVGSRPPIIDPHSVVKHEIVRSYLERYIEVLLSNVRIEKLTLSIVDGFAGGGEYSPIGGQGAYHDGSPLIAFDTVTEQQAKLNATRTKPPRIDAKYYFVEKQPDNYAYLERVLGVRLPSAALGTQVRMFREDFRDAVRPIMADIKARRGGERALFLLDQYAYDQVSAPLLREIFGTLDNAEVLLTFNVDSLISFLGDNEQSRKKLEEMGLAQYIDWDAFRLMKGRNDPLWKSLIQRNLARGLTEGSGARHSTIFYITPMGATTWTYWLVHLSNAYKARDVMMELHWQNANHFSHYLEPDLFTLGYSGNSDSRATRQEILLFEEAHRFDARAEALCLEGLSTKLTRHLYDTNAPMRFEYLLHSIGSFTPATANMIRRSLNQGIVSGDLIAFSKDGARREKGTTLHNTDIIERSPQQPIIFRAS